jgi:hypothetical protein
MPILERLPAKSLFRFRCVFKELCSLLSDGYHLIYHRSQDSDHFTHYSLHHPETYDQCFRFELPSKIGKLFYVNSFHGVCCLFGHPDVVVLWNPLIREFRTLLKPSLPEPLSRNSIRASRLYRYAHGLIDHKDFLTWAREGWNISVCGLPMYQLYSELRAVKKVLKRMSLSGTSSESFRG